MNDIVAFVRSIDRANFKQSTVGSGFLVRENNGFFLLKESLSVDVYVGGEVFNFSFDEYIEFEIRDNNGKTEVRLYLGTLLGKEFFSWWEPLDSGRVEFCF